MLQIALLANGTFSGISGYTMLMFSVQITGLLGIHGPILEIVVMVLGGMLAIYCVALYAVAMQPQIPRPWVSIAILLDLGWVIGSILLLVSGWIEFAFQGVLLIAVVAAVVAGFALVQYRAVKRLPGARSIEQEIADSGPILRAIAGSWMSMQGWSKWWFLSVNAVFILGSIFYGQERVIAWVLITYITTLPFLLAIMIPQRGLSRILGLAYLVPWTPLLVYVLLHLVDNSILGPRIRATEQLLLFGYLVMLSATLGSCLVAGYYNVVRWLRGERYTMGSEEAYRKGASTLVRTAPA